MATLLALFGPKRGVRIDVGSVCTVGRSSSADVQLIDEKVSREHCRFTIEGGVARVEDLGSHNGTYVNGEKVEAPRVLAPGDEIAIGDSLFVFQPEVDVAPARFGDATLIVSPPGPPGATGAGGASSPPRTAPVTPAHLVALAKLGGALAMAPDTETAARAVLDAITASPGGDRAFVLLWDPSRRAVTPLVGKSDGPAVTISRRVLEAAADGRKVVSIDDAVESRSFKDAKSVIRHGLRSVLVAPVLHGDRVEGFLHVDSKQVGAYSEADVHLMEAFAALAAAHRLGVPRALAPVAARPPAGGDTASTPAGESAAWKEALRVAESAAAVSSTVLVTGESGTGKEEVARFVHARSPRAAKPFVAVNCGAIPEALAESELFGHEKGAFTGATATREGKVEAADGGTLFLDEIGDLAPSIQVKLLRVLQERAFYRVGSTIPRRVDVRVIAATHHDLESEVKAGRFREDLFYRLNVLRIHLPPLRERTDDLEPLAHALLHRICVNVGRRNPGLSKESLQALCAHAWPGNARELANVLERMVVLRAPGSDGPFGRMDVASALGAGPAAAFGADPGAALPGATLAEKVAALEKAEVEAALKRARGVKSRAAEMLGISRPTLDKKIADLSIDIWKEPG